MRVRVLVVDDEPPARRKILRLLRRDPGVELLGEAGDGAEALRRIRELRPDLVFLDVQMPGTDGFGVLGALGPEELPAVVFVTAFDEHAIRAFEVAAVDYLLKPFDAERFALALERARRRIAAGSAGQFHETLRSLISTLEAERRGLERVIVRTRDRALPLRVRDIAWLQAAGNYVQLHVGRTSYLLRETLEGFTARLDARFLRVHRSYVVNADHIREIQPWSHGDHIVVMRDGARVRLSRRYRERLPEPFRSW
jgi:two-component system LytT family response regulator